MANGAGSNTNSSTSSQAMRFSAAPAWWQPAATTCAASEVPSPGRVLAPAPWLDGYALSCSITAAHTRSLCSHSSTWWIAGSQGPAAALPAGVNTAASAPDVVNADASAACPANPLALLLLPSPASAPQQQRPQQIPAAHALALESSAGLACAAPDHLSLLLQPLANLRPVIGNDHSGMMSKPPPSAAPAATSAPLAASQPAPPAVVGGQWMEEHLATQLHDTPGELTAPKSSCARCRGLREWSWCVLCR